MLVFCSIFSVHSNFHYESKRVQYQSRLPLGCLSFLNFDIFNKTLTAVTLKLSIRICRDSSANKKDTASQVWSLEDWNPSIQRGGDRGITEPCCFPDCLEKQRKSIQGPEEAMPQRNREERISHIPLWPLDMHTAVYTHKHMRIYTTQAYTVFIHIHKHIK